MTDITQCAFAPIADHRSGKRRAFAAVFGKNMLDHFFAALVFEIDVDVGRFIAFLRQESLEQQIAVLGIDRGDAKAITHG